MAVAQALSGKISAAHDTVHTVIELLNDTIPECGCLITIDNLEKRSWTEKYKDPDLLVESKALLAMLNNLYEPKEGAPSLPDYL